ncbi:MAG: S8 family serine peptidase [Leptospirales bacterium]|nr:S8 family serine peptidase [Leptospirales bacterium]
MRLSTRPGHTRVLFIPILFSLILWSCFSTYSRVPAPYKQTFSDEIGSVKVDPESIDPRVQYRPGLVQPTPVSRVIRDAESGSYVAKDEYIVLLKTGQNPDDLLAELKEAKISASLTGYVPTFRLVQLQALEDTEGGALSKIRVLPSVEQIHPHYVRKGQANPQKGAAWHIARYGLEDVWKRTNGSGVVLAVLDTGLDISLPAWGNRITSPYSVLTRSSRFEDGETKRGGDVLRVVDHGTRVASVASAGEMNGISTGIAPGAQIMPVQVIGFHKVEEELYTNDLTILEGLARAMAFKAQIINVSLGTDYARALRGAPSESRENVLRTIQRESKAVREIYNGPFEMARKLNVWIVVAAGNSADSADNEPIASHPYVISVGAIDSEDRRASFSNFGSTVSTYAPGVGVPTLLPGGTLVASSGTSFSAPYVTGILALIRSHNPYLSFEQAKALVTKTNISTRMSILPAGNVLPVFDPIGLFVLNGIPVKRDVHRSKRRFYDRFHDIFIEAEDSDDLKLTRILAYYSRVASYSPTDPEAQAAFPLVPKNFGVIRSRDSGSISFNEAILLGDAPLTDEQVIYFKEKLPTNDYLALTLWKKNHRAAIPLLLARLKQKQFNGNTLSTLAAWNEEGTHEHIVNYMKMLHARPAWQEDEAPAMLALVRTASSLSDHDKALLAACVPRYREEFFEMARENLVERHANNVVEALIQAGNRDGIVLALDGADQIQRSLSRMKPDEESNDFLDLIRNSREALGVRLEDLQRQINESTAFSVRFNHQAPYLERERARSQFLQYIKNAQYRNGKFYER